MADHSGESWSNDDVQKLRELAESNTPVGLIANQLGRSEESVRSKAQTESISFGSPNRSPYGKMT